MGLGKQKTITKEYNELLKFIDFYHELIDSNRYIAKSEYLDKIKQYDKTINFFSVLNTSGLLNDYCKKNGLNKKEIEKAIINYVNFNSLIDKHNELFIKQELVSKKKYLDNILKDVDPNIVLDNNQRQVILNDEDHCLVIAGAGAGKTTTVAAKAKYLVEKLHIPENEILIVSFTNKAVEELRDRINDKLKLNCIISTFHSIGNAILKTNSDEKLNVSRDGTLYNVLLEYFKSSVLTNESLTRNLVLFFSTYFNMSYESDELSEYLISLSKNTNVSLKSDLNEYVKQIIDTRSKKKETITSEILRSSEEVQIANFLYLNNIDYEYEPVYPYSIKLANKPYTPDFIIRQDDKVAYIEHFGITQSGENSFYSEDELEKYKKAVNDKIKLHRKHNTKLFYTFSKFNDGRSFLEHLATDLQANGFVLKKKDDKQVLQKIIDSQESKYISRLIILVSKFINLFKTNGYTIEKFDEFKNSTKNVRSHLFLDICKECYLEYERKLKQSNSIDFQDMINDSAKLLEQMALRKEKLHFKYVIVDEYQDISRQRFDLVTALKKVCDAKIIAVGDDWQSIYAFSGSDVKLFLDFQKKMGYAKLLKIENTYRNSQEVIDIAGNFIQKNDAQIAKALKSPKHIKDPVIIYTYDSSAKGNNTNNKSGSNYNIAQAIEKCLDDIIKYNKKDKKNDKDILILGRYNFDQNNLEKSGLFEIVNKQGKIKSFKYPKLSLTFMTAHASKGLGYDDVIIINCINGTFGFPSKIQNDPVMKHVLIEDKSYDYAEERRLFYVAMTRTKNRVFFVAPQDMPSEFVIEIKKEYKKVIKYGEWNENSIKQPYRNICPVCGYPMQYKYKPAYGLKLNICTNQPEICGFMSNELKAGKMQIMKCDQCVDGYLIIKQSNKDYFLGCTNYKQDGSGCNNTITREKYFEMQSLTPDTPIEANPKVIDPKAKDMSLNIIKQKIDVRPYNINNNKDLTDLYLVSKIIINAVNTIAQKRYLGISKIISLLFGEKVTAYKAEELYKINEYGALKHCDKNDIEALIYSLILNKYLLKTKEEYPVIHPTNKGQEFIKVVDKQKVKELYKKYLDVKGKMKIIKS